MKGIHDILLVSDHEHGIHSVSFPCVVNDLPVPRQPAVYPGHLFVVAGSCSAGIVIVDGLLDVFCCTEGREDGSADLFRKGCLAVQDLGPGIRLDVVVRLPVIHLSVFPVYQLCGISEHGLVQSAFFQFLCIAADGISGLFIVEECRCDILADEVVIIGVEEVFTESGDVHDAVLNGIGVEAGIGAFRHDVRLVDDGDLRIPGIQPGRALVIGHDENTVDPRCVLFHRAQGVLQFSVIRKTALVVGFVRYIHGPCEVFLLLPELFVGQVAPEIDQINILIQHTGSFYHAVSCTMITMHGKWNYSHTLYACYTGYITQAIVNNFAPLLFITFAASFSLTLDRIALITTLNFAVQLIVDLVSVKYVDRIGYRFCVVSAHVFSVLGLVGLAVLPSVMRSAYAGILVSVVLYAIGGGLIEVLISPIVEACPTERKEAAMSLLHSFYCWGHVGVILVSTLFFRLFGFEHWRALAVLWALVPLVNAFLFTKVPILSVTGDADPLSLTELFSNKLFWIFMIIMICAGASEHSMSQWASAYAESALGVVKTVGDLAGPGGFAFLMGTSRALYGKYSEKIPLRTAMALSAVLCAASYCMASLTHLPLFGLLGCALCGFSVGLFWPGTFSLMAVRMPGAGTAMYALMALAGDLGCSFGPTLVGFAANAVNGNLKAGLLTALVFPVLIIIGVSMLRTEKQ